MSRLDCKKSEPVFALSGDIAILASSHLFEAAVIPYAPERERSHLLPASCRPTPSWVRPASPLYSFMPIHCVALDAVKEIPCSTS